MTYKEYIQNIIDTRGQWGITEGYFEVHHIIPKCMGGEGEIRKGSKRQKHPNLIYLYAHEHFIAHKLLAEENPTNVSLIFAWSMMAFPKGTTHRDFEITPEEYKELRKMCAFGRAEQNKQRTAWNKGLTKETDERLRKVSENSKGVNTWTKGLKRSEETKQKMSESVRQRYINNPESFKSYRKGYIGITNGEINTFVKDESNIPDGFRRGMTCKYSENHKLCWTDERRQQRSTLYSGEKNPMYGNGHKLSGGKNGHAIYIYTYKGVDYDCRDDLMIVLKKEYPLISESTIRCIQGGKYTKRITNKYQSVIDNLYWRKKK